MNGMSSFLCLRVHTFLFFLPQTCQHLELHLSQPRQMAFIKARCPHQLWILKVLIQPLPSPATCGLQTKTFLPLSYLQPLSYDLHLCSHKHLLRFPQLLRSHLPRSLHPHMFLCHGTYCLKEIPQLQGHHPPLLLLRRYNRPDQQSQLSIQGVRPRLSVTLCPLPVL